MFPFPTLVEYFQGPENPACGLGAVLECIRTIARKNTDPLPDPLDLKGRMQYLQSRAAKTIWETLYEALRNMWSLGVVHQDRIKIAYAMIVFYVSPCKQRSLR